MRRLSYILILMIVALGRCTVPQTLPDIPSVKYKSFILEERPNPLGSNVLTGLLTFEFEDGDGDVGFNASFDSLDVPDTIKYNLFLTIHEKVEGEFRMIDPEELDSKPFYRIPPLDREGQNKTLKGEIEVQIEYFTIDYDTLKYSFYIMDRAFNRSNVDTTEVISFTEWMDE